MVGGSNKKQGTPLSISTKVVLYLQLIKNHILQRKNAKK